MSSLVLTDAKIWVAQYDLSTFSNRVGLDYSIKPLNDTRFSQTTEVNAAGVKVVACAFGGFGEEGATGSNAAIFSRVGVTGAFSTAPQGNSAGDVAYSFDALQAQWDAFGPHGTLLPFGGNAKGAGSPLVRGTLMAPKAARTSNGNSGTALQLGAVSASQRIYAALHVFAASGTTPTLDVTVKSDNGVGFGSPATQITFTQATAVTSEWKSAAGAITDDYWRVDWTVGGSGPSFTFAVVIGIAAP